MFCGNCGNQVNEGQAICPYCGVSLLSGKKQKSGKGKMVFFLVLFLAALLLLGVLVLVITSHGSDKGGPLSGFVKYLWSEEDDTESGKEASENEAISGKARAEEEESASGQSASVDSRFQMTTEENTTSPLSGIPDETGRHELTPVQKSGLKEALEGVVYFGEYDSQTKDFGELLFDMVNLNGIYIKDRYGIPVEVSSEDGFSPDPLGIWGRSGDVCYRSEKTQTDKCLEKYFHVSPYTDNRQIIYKNGDQVCVYEMDGYYYWFIYDMSSLAHSIQVETIEYISNGNYKVVYDYFEENWEATNLDENEVCLCYQDTREATIGLIDTNSTEWSFYTISGKGKLDNRQQTKYMEINPAEVEDCTYVTLEGTLQKRPYMDPAEEIPFEINVLTLETPVQMQDEYGGEVAVDIVAIMGEIPVDDSMYGTKVLVHGMECYGVTGHYYGDFNIMDPLLYRLVY